VVDSRAKYTCTSSEDPPAVFPSQEGCKTSGGRLGRSTHALLPRTLQLSSLFHIPSDLVSDLFSSKYDRVQMLPRNGHKFGREWSIKDHSRALPVWGRNFIRRTRCSLARLTARDLGVTGDLEGVQVVDWSRRRFAFWGAGGSGALYPTVQDLGYNKEMQP
jgi:hypothetical protein